MPRVPFMVRLRFRTPVAVGSFGLLPALDALLAAQVMARRGDLIPAPRQEPRPVSLPLDELAPGCWAASVLMPTAVPDDDTRPQKDRPAGAHLYARSYLGPHWHGLAMPEYTDVSASSVRDSSRGPFVTHQRKAGALIVPEAVAFGRGDPWAVAELLRGVWQVGGQRGIGYGLLRQPPLVQRVAEDRTLRDPQDGKLLRIVPVRLASALGLDIKDSALKAVVRLASCRPPLWYRPWWEPCLVPLPLNARYVTGTLVVEKEAGANG